MGVRRSDYILIGTKLPYDLCDEEFFESGENDSYLYEKRIGHMKYITDGMGGEYFIAGILIILDEDGYNGLGYKEFSTTSDTEFISYKEYVRKHIKEKFNIDVFEPKLIVLTHWS